MARHGQKRHVKRIAVPKHIPIRNKKETTFITKPLPGPHTGKSSMALTTFLVEVLKIPHSNKEARYLLTNKLVKVDGIPRSEEKMPVGLWEVIEVEGSGAFRVSLDDHGRLVAYQEKDELKAKKPLKIKNKNLIKGGKIQLTFNDGRTILTSDNKFKVNDVVLFDLDKKQIVEHIKAEPGTTCFIIDGKHRGKSAKLKVIEQKGEASEKTAVLEKDGEEIRTKYEYIFPLPEGFYGQ